MGLFSRTTASVEKPTATLTIKTAEIPCGSSELATRARLIEGARKLDGSINAAIGPSGCGKSDTQCRTSLAAAFNSGLKWYAYDSNGDVQRHFVAIVKYHRDAAVSEPAKRDHHMKRLRFMREQCSFYSGPSKLPKLLSSMKATIERGIKEAERGVVAKPKMIVFVDEAGAVRDEDEGFWPYMRQARNAGVTLYTTGHRVKDWHPAALAVIRTAILWKPVIDDKYEINGMKIKRAQCTEPKSDRLLYIIGSDPKMYVWDRSKSQDTYPPALIVPAQPTVGRAAGF